MALRNQPYLPLYVNDFMVDERLRECSAESTGVYIRLMCLMHKSDEYGVISIDDAKGGDVLPDFCQKFARHLPYEIDVIDRSLRELIKRQVLTLEGNRLFQKRMVRDGEISKVRSEVGKGGGFAKAKALKKGSGKTPSKSLANSENENEYISGNKSLNTKTKYADYVLMTDTQYATLTTEIGESGAKRCIEILDNYKGASGTKYKSDYHAIRNWVIKRWREEGEKPSADQFPDFA